MEPTHRWTTLPAWVTGVAPWLATLTAALAWVLSYTAQVQLALAHRYAPWEAALWPLTTDLASLVLMIIALDAADTRRRGATVRAALLSLLAAAVMVTGNALIAWPDWIAVLQHCWPPLIGASIWFILAHDRPRRAPSSTFTPAGDEVTRPGLLASPRSLDRPPAGQYNSADVERAIAELEERGQRVTRTSLAAMSGISVWQAQRYLRRRRQPRVVQENA